jgi:hypothetical protein
MLHVLFLYFNYMCITNFAVITYFNHMCCVRITNFAKEITSNVHLSLQLQPNKKKILMVLLNLEKMVFEH